VRKTNFKLIVLLSSINDKQPRSDKLKKSSEELRKTDEKLVASVLYYEGVIDIEKLTNFCEIMENLSEKMVNKKNRNRTQKS
jgi:hypothetical protein